MVPYYDRDGITIYHGDCREVLPTLEEESVTLMWTDPPYGLATCNRLVSVMVSKALGFVRFRRLRTMMRTP